MNINFVQAKMQELSSVRAVNRIHFTNSCRYQAGTYSCTIDCLLEICHSIFYPALLTTVPYSPFLSVLSSHYNFIIKFFDKIIMM